MMRPRGRWRNKAAWISLYALLLSIGVHSMLTLGFRVPAREQGKWPVARPFVLIAQPREPGSKPASAGQPRATAGRFAAATPRFASDARAALEAMARMPVSPVPLLLLRASSDSRGAVEASEPSQRQWRWHIECEGQVPPSLAQSLEKLEHTPLENVRVAPRPAVFSGSVVEPGTLRSFALVVSSGDIAFDQMAREALRTTPLEQGAGMHARMDAPRSYARFRVAITIEAAP